VLERIIPYLSNKRALKEVARSAAKESIAVK